MDRNKESYNQERKMRWWMAKECEQPAIEILAKNINRKFSECNIVPIR